MFDGTHPKLMVLCIQLASKELAFYVGKYEEGVGVLFYDGPREGDDKFSINKDGTISPLKAPNLDTLVFSCRYCEGWVLTKAHLEVVPGILGVLCVIYSAGSSIILLWYLLAKVLVY